MLWVKSLVHELGFCVKKAMPMYFDNLAAIFIMNNLTFHKNTKDIEIDCHVVRDQVLAGLISLSHLVTSAQIVDTFTEGLSVTSYDPMSHNTSFFNFYVLV